MDKKTQLKKFGITIKQRREALNLSIRELARISNISAALITKLENGKTSNFPKALTIKQLSDALRFDNELFFIADILFEPKYLAKKEPRKTFEEELRELLATRTELNSENISQIIYFAKGLEKLQKINKISE